MGSLSRFISYLLLLILFITPLQGLWVKYLEYQGITGRPLFLVTNWYEAVGLILAPLSLILIISRRIKFGFLDVLLAITLLLGFISYFWLDSPLSWHLVGIRYSVLPIAFYFFARASDLQSRTIDRVLQVVFSLVVGIALLQLVAWLFFPPYLPEELAFGIRDFAAKLPRLYGSLIGPNQLGTYLVLVFIHLYFRNRINRYLAVLPFIALAATFSRSAMLAALGVVLLDLVIAHGRRISWKMSLALLGVLVGVIGLGSLVSSANINEVLSTARHFPTRIAALEVAVEKIGASSPAELVFGHGPGTAGPGTFVRDEIFVPENWFLQIFFEYGLVGFITFIGALICVVALGFRNNRPEISYMAVAIMINSLFLHPLADNPAAALLFFIVLGVLVSEVRERRIENNYETLR